MDTPSNITDSLDQTDEDFLNPTVSDDAIEAAGGHGGENLWNISGHTWAAQCFHCSLVHHCELILSGASVRYLRLVQITG
jgi:hypothetical protein